MKKLRYIQGGWLLLLAALVLSTSFVSPFHPALASTSTTRHASVQKQQAASTSVDTVIYLTMGMLEPKFRQDLSQQVPGSVNSAINAMVSKLPAQDQGWAREMASTLIQPTVTLLSLKPVQKGLAMSIRLALYPGDPRPINASVLVGFSVLDSSTIQVSTAPLNNSPALSSGPQSTFQVPMGVLTGVNSTPSCGDSALALHLQVPVSLSQTTSTTAQTQSALASSIGRGNPMAVTLKENKNGSGANTFIEIPASSLAALSGSIGSIPVSSSLTAKNIRITVQGSTINLLADIYWAGLNIGTADTTITPGASGGNLLMHVTNTSFNLFGLFNFPVNSYNQQIEQMLDSQIGPAFAGMFTVDSAAIGSNSHIPCAQSDSLILTGSSSIGG